MTTNIVESALTGRYDKDTDLAVGVTYEIVLRVRARCIDRSDAHGVCHAIQLEARDFSSTTRTVWVDHDEIVVAIPHPPQELKK